MEHLLEIKDLKVEFPSKAGNIHAVNGVNLYVDEGEILGVVGESGCGKSVTLSNV
ncbi:ATP-binding cassette domain-containing protein, partial [[Clostridium] symbiosum]